MGLVWRGGDSLGHFASQGFSSWYLPRCSHSGPHANSRPKTVWRKFIQYLKTEYFKDYGAGKLILDVTLLRPLFELSRVFTTRLMRSTKSAGGVIIIIVAIIITTVILVIENRTEVVKAFKDTEAIYVAILAPVLPLLGSAAGVFARIQQYRKYNPESLSGTKKVTPHAGATADFGKDVGKMEHVQMMFAFIVDFLQTRPVFINGIAYDLNILISFDDIDRCKPLTVLHVSYNGNPILGRFVTNLLEPQALTNEQK